MDSIKVELKVLIECLRKKETSLRQIASITENQGFVITSDLTHEERYSFFMEMNKEKQIFIKKVQECDQVFGNVFQKVGPVLDAQPSNYGVQVDTMQKLIRSVMDLDVQIRVEEDNNSKMLTNALDKVKLTIKEKPDIIGGGEYGSNKIINAYKSQSKNK